MRMNQFAALGVVIATTVVAAQDLAFDVASIKRAGDVRERASRTPGRYYEPAITFRRLIAEAYGLQPFRVLGGPDWVDSDLWSVDGRSQSPTKGDEMRLMLRRLLQERFNLELRAETRELPIFELKLARTDGTLGPNLKPSSRDCSLGPCGPGRDGLAFDSVQIASLGAPMSALVAQLETYLRRIVRDATGLTGRYDINLRFAAETGLPWLPSLETLASQPAPPALATALQEQLGLRLDSGQASVDVLAIARAQRATAD